MADFTDRADPNVAMRNVDSNPETVISVNLAGAAGDADGDTIELIREVPEGCRVVDAALDVTTVDTGAGATSFDLELQNVATPFALAETTEILAAVNLKALARTELAAGEQRKTTARRRLGARLNIGGAYVGDWEAVLTVRLVREDYL